MLICVDPGHGGLDSGAVGIGGLQEKYVNLAVGCMVYGLLKTVYNVEAFLTHAEYGLGGTPFSEKRDLDGRVQMANEQQADFFVSIHADSYKNPNAKGTAIYIYRKGGKSEGLAEWIRKPLIRTLQTKDLGVRTANFEVLRETKMPAVLIELAFISNPDDAKKLASPYWLQRAAAGIAWGINCYVKGWEVS